MAGRPRNPASSTAILAAAVALIRERGYAELTLDEVARVAGVGKSSLYARFAGKQQLAAAAVASLQRELPPPTGELRRDLCATLRAAGHNLRAAGPDALAALLASRQDAAGLDARQLLRPAFSALGRILSAARARGELPGSADLDSALELLLALLSAGAATDGAPDPRWVGVLEPRWPSGLEPRWPEPAVDLILRGLRAPA